MRKTTALRKLIESPKILALPRVHDCLSARAAQDSGFEAAQVSGHGIAAAVLGVPDIGLLGLAENVFITRHIAAAVTIPVMADGDTGYGNALNVYYMVEQFEAAGVAGINIEDQVYPKKCGHMDGKDVIGRDEMVQKIKAAVSARKDPDFIINARTDAIATHGLDEAIARGIAYAEAGADLIYVEAPADAASIARIVREIDAPISVCLALGGKTQPLSLLELQELGVARVSVGGSYFVAAQAYKRSSEALRGDIALQDNAELWMPRQDFYAMVNLPHFLNLERQYLTEDDMSRRYIQK